MELTRGLMSWAAVVAIGVTALGISLWASITTVTLALPSRLWIPVANTATPGLELAIAITSSRRFMESLKLPLATTCRYILHVAMFMSFAFCILSLELAWDSSMMDCSAEKSWISAFRSKNEATIRRVQDQLKCCGFNSIRDRAWPFPSREQAAGTCQQISGFKVPCAPLWKERTSTVAILNSVASVFNMILTSLVARHVGSIQDNEDDILAEIEDIRHPLLGSSREVDHEVMATEQEERRRAAERSRMQ